MEGPIRGWDDVYKEYFPIIDRLGESGDIAEFGVYDGGNTRLLAKYGRKVWAFDTFEGMPTEEFDRYLDRDEPGKFHPTEPISKLFEGYSNVVPVKGRFIETLLTLRDDVKFIFCFIDPDLYESHKQVLDWLPSHLSNSAVLLFDDYTCLPGAMKAIDEFREKWNLPIHRECLIFWNERKHN